jgi:hypothetical protein
VVGVIYAFSHLFVAYQIPVSVAYTYYPGEVASKIAYSLPSDLSATASSAIATASAGVGSWLKKAALRAAGYEGLAENVLNEQGRPFGIDAVHAAEGLVAREETRFRDELQWVHCLDTSGQVFAILLNCMYLLPLTWLFLQFFITSYLKRGETRRHSSASELAVRARQSLQDASKGVARRLSEAVEEMHRTSEDIGEEDAIVDTEEVKNELGQVAQQVKNTAKKASKKARQAASKANTETVVEEFQRDLELMKEGAMNLGEKIKTATGSAVEQAKNLKDAAVEQTQKTADAAEDATTTATQKGKKTTKQAKDLKNSAAQKAEKSAQQAKDVKDSAAEKSKKTTDEAEDAAAEAGDKAEKKAQDIKEETEKSSAETSKKEKAPNGSGTGAEEATGQTSPQPKSDEVQSDEHEAETSEVQEGKSFADALKE